MHLPAEVDRIIGQPVEMIADATKSFTKGALDWTGHSAVATMGSMLFIATHNGQTDD